MTNTLKTIAAALALYVIWTAATWFLEGRIETLLRPDAVADRLVYALTANLIVGIIGASVVLRFILGWKGADRTAAGFGSPIRTSLAIVAGLGLGLAFYVLSGGASSDPVVVANAFAQVLVVSAAEVIVCWAVVGSAFETAFRDLGRGIAVALAAPIASALFGLYHFAHSAPFNTAGMVLFLAAIGLVTSLFFFVSRDLYGTIAFHNFLGVVGVVDALAAEDKLQSMTQLQPPLIATAVVAIVVLVLADRFVIRRAAD